MLLTTATTERAAGRIHIMYYHHGHARRIVF